MRNFSIKTWDNCLSIEETLEAYKIIKRLVDAGGYSSKDAKYIKKNFLMSIGDPYSSVDLNQLYAEFGMIPACYDEYQKHLDNIRAIFGLDRHIVDVACGHIPILANKIAKEQIKLKLGTVTVIDKSLIFKNSRFSNMKLLRDEFSLETDPLQLGIQSGSLNRNLLVGISPCEVTQTMIDYAINHDLDFYIAFCACAYYSKIRFERPTRTRVLQVYENNFINNAREKVRKKSMGEVKITYLKDSYIPIIYNQRSKI